MKASKSVGRGIRDWSLHFCRRRWKNKGGGAMGAEQQWYGGREGRWLSTRLWWCGDAEDREMRRWVRWVRKETKERKKGREKRVGGIRELGKLGRCWVWKRMNDTKRGKMGFRVKGSWEDELNENEWHKTNKRWIYIDLKWYRFNFKIFV